MTPSGPPVEDLPGQVQFRGSTASGDTVVEPDTEVVVTDEVVAVHPMAEAEPNSPLAFTVSLDEILRVRCEGFVCRSITLETPTETYEIPTLELDELNFRRAIVENANLSNTCMRLNLDRLGICPCGAGTYTGCVFTVIGIAMVFSVVGALLGAVFLTAGLALLLLSYGARKYGQLRGANVWERESNETDATA